MMRCEIVYYLYNLENAKNNLTGVLLLVVLKVTLLHGCFSCFSNLQMIPNPATHHIFRTEKHLRPCQTSLTELFAKIMYKLKPLTIFVKSAFTNLRNLNFEPSLKLR